MFKTTLLKGANFIAFVLFFLFFNTTNAQSVIKKTKCEEKSLGFIKSPIVFTDLIISVETKENDGLIKIKSSNVVSRNDIVSIIKEADALDANYDSILFVQYYKQFVIFYKNIS
jgi:hypothetical protein